MSLSQVDVVLFDEFCADQHSSRFKFLLHILTLDNGLARLKKDEMRLQLQCEAVFLFRHSVVGVQNGRHGSKTAFHF